jgi:predicted AAA+ superfamily ATPase
MTEFKRFFHPPEGSFFLFGPRGTGKSTWLKEHYPHALFIDLLLSDTLLMYEARPDRLVETVLAHPGKTIVIDEVQKVPPLLAVVHHLIEQKRGWQFILTGSNSRKLKNAGVDLLAGRAIMQTMHPFMAGELGKRFNLQNALQLGMLPLIVDHVNPESALSTYVGMYLRDEVQKEGEVRDMSSFSRFLEKVSFSHASTLNLSNISRECHVERRTVDGYISILEDFLAAYQLPIFTQRAKRELAAHPKFYLFDPGIFRAMMPRPGPLDKPEELQGLALEGLVIQHLRAWNAYGGDKHGIYYWKTRSKVEVDAIVYGKDGFWAIEIKNGETIHPRDLHGLQAFHSDYPECRPLLLYRGKELLLKGKILCVPCELFLKELRPNQPLDAAFPVNAY